MGPPRSIRPLAAFLLAAVAGCGTATSPFPSTGSLQVSIRYTDLGGQGTLAPVPFAVTFRIRALTAELDGGETFSFLGRSPCVYPYSIFNVLSPSATELTRQCSGGGLVLESGIARTTAFRLELDAVDVLFIDRPNLSSGGDYDGDGVPNQLDNCPIQPNPPGSDGTQPDVNGDGVGDACSFVPQGSTDPIVPDQDLDGVADSVDNCLFIPNPAGSDGLQADANRNGVGDACERVAPVLLTGSGSWSDVLRCPGASDPPLAFTPTDSTVIHWVVDFTRAIRCDSVFSACSLDLGALKVRRASASFDDPENSLCEAVP